jgi:cupin 2 domain-containing protein
VKPQNILRELAEKPKDELIEALVDGDNVKIERIVSSGQATPPDQWYDQDWDEWVVLLTGAARLRFEDKPDVVLEPGDTLLLPAHCKHRVEWTDPEQQSIWLAVHFPSRENDKR